MYVLERKRSQIVLICFVFIVILNFITSTNLLIFLSTFHKIEILILLLRLIFWTLRLYIHVYIQTYIHLSTCIYIRIHIHTYINTYIHTHAHIYFGVGILPRSFFNPLLLVWTCWYILLSRVTIYWVTIYIITYRPLRLVLWGFCKMEQVRLIYLRLNNLYFFLRCTDSYNLQNVF